MWSRRVLKSPNHPFANHARAGGTPTGLPARRPHYIGGWCLRGGGLVAADFARFGLTCLFVSAIRLRLLELVM